MTPRDLLLAAGHLVHLAELAGDAPRQHAHVDREYGAIGAAMRGVLAPSDLSPPLDLFTTPGRALAFVCAARAASVLGPATTPHHARRVLVMLPRLDMPLDVWGELLRAAETDLDIAEHVRGGPQAVQRLTIHGRTVLALARLRPALETLMSGRADPATITALRDAADILDEVTT
jgi:hypothetical protein